MAEKRTIARPYAQAVFAIAEEQNALKAWSEMLAAAATVAAHPDVLPLYGNPRFDRDALAGLFLDICGDALSERGRNLIKVLAENDRLMVLPEIAALYETARAEAESTVKAQVVSATTLSDAQKQTIAEALKRRLGRDVSLECSVDEALVGGAIIRAGDLVIDGSVVGKLERLRSQLLH